MDSLFNNPFVGMNDIHVDNNNYLNMFVFYHNFATSAIFPLLHILLCVILIIKTKGGNASVTNLQKQMIIQSIVISAFLVIASLTFVYMQLFPVGHIYMIFSHFSWQACHGASVFTYIFINKSMRNEAILMIKQLLGIQARIDPLNPVSVHINPTWLKGRAAGSNNQTNQTDNTLNVNV
uniref:Uncharacterized protein n=1 Tax=Acrobeloides nanus TaxID=290746 RepID=A0A914C766_9BILA